MTALDFKSAWEDLDDNLRPISVQTLNKFKLSHGVIDFLSISGLPDSAAPFLSFVGDVDSQIKYSTIALLTDWFNFLESEFNRFLVVGTDGSGDIIALDLENNCSVVWLDHDNYFTPRFMNSSVNQLANSLLVYREFISNVNQDKTSSKAFDTSFTDSQFDILKDMLCTIDPKAIEIGFWREALDILWVNREDFQRK